MADTDEKVQPDAARKARREWLDAMAADPAVPAGAFRTAYALAGYINARTGEAWPSQTTLAERSGIGDRAVRKHLDALQRLGWLIVLTGRDRTAPKTTRGLHYRIVRPEQTGTLVPVSSDSQTGTDAQSNRNNRAVKPERPFRLTLLEPLKKGPRSSADPIQDRERNYPARARLGAPDRWTGEEDAFDDRELLPDNLDGPLDPPDDLTLPPDEYTGPDAGDLIDLGGGATIEARPDGDDAAAARTVDPASAVREALSRRRLDVSDATLDPGEIDQLSRAIASETGLALAVVEDALADIIDPVGEDIPWGEPIYAEASA